MIKIKITIQCQCTYDRKIINKSVKCFMLFKRSMTILVQCVKVNQSKLKLNQDIAEVSCTNGYIIDGFTGGLPPRYQLQPPEKVPTPLEKIPIP